MNVTSTSDEDGHQPTSDQQRFDTSPPFLSHSSDRSNSITIEDDDHATIHESQSRETSLFIILAVGLGGLQIVYSVLYSYGLTHLRSLGLSKSQAATSFIAGPVCGIFVQPFFGLWSDHCRLSWGKRKPFIALGGCALIVCLMGLAWTKPIVDLFLPNYDLPDQLSHGSGDAKNFITATMGVLFTFGIYFSSQPVQGGLRALIVDVCPIHQQQQANAWVSLISGLASILGYLWAVLDLSRHVSSFGDTQFKNLSSLASLSMTAALAICCVCVKEKNPRFETATKPMRSGRHSVFGLPLPTQTRRTFDMLVRMPSQILHIFIVQFFAWVGWYPYLLYVSTYVTDIYGAETKARSPSQMSSNTGIDWEYASRIGPLALLISSTVSVLTAIILPALTQPRTSCHPRHRKISLGYFFHKMKSSRPDLVDIWMCSHILFAICMISTLFVTSVAGTITIFGFVGVSWAVATWIPYTLLNMEISRATKADFRNEPFPTGLAISLHNVAICVPQILISIGSSLYWNRQDEDSHDPNATGVVLRIGGLAALLALWMTSSIRRPSIDDESGPTNSSHVQSEYEMGLLDSNDTP
ncbi:general alpha-glucoside [Phlyctema vagabunda]|uniref:General alpha-glucoside n=1 Tax=Phlyctema vagabunda TaxID=108571 RepID=A0ABR4P3C7_9HELO